MKGSYWSCFCVNVIFCNLSKAHISSLIKSKFTDYKDFDTMMYTCAAEFDFMEIEVGGGMAFCFLHDSYTFIYLVNSMHLVKYMPLNYIHVFCLCTCMSSLLFYCMF